ncbi:hypothetical protein ACFLYP_01225 [Chloroflexota bacterium]
MDTQKNNALILDITNIVLAVIIWLIPNLGLHIKIAVTIVLLAIVILFRRNPSIFGFDSKWKYLTALVIAFAIVFVETTLVNSLYYYFMVDRALFSNYGQFLGLMALVSFVFTILIALPATLIAVYFSKTGRSIKVGTYFSLMYQIVFFVIVFLVAFYAPGTSQSSDFLTPSTAMFFQGPMHAVFLLFWTLGNIVLQAIFFVVGLLVAYAIVYQFSMLGRWLAAERSA